MTLSVSLQPFLLGKMLSKLALPSKKGGARHKPAPIVDPHVLAAVFGKFKSSIADFGIYEHVSVNQACKGNGLVAHYDFLKAMLTLCPSGDMPGNSARTALLTVICNAPEMNSTIYNSAVWAGMRCERLGCMLNHLRRLAREGGRFKQAAMAMTGPDLAKLKTLVSMLDVSECGLVADGLASGMLGSDDDATIEEHEPKPRKRLLTKTASDVSQISVDSQGFPAMLEPASSSKAPKRLSSSSLQKPTSCIEEFGIASSKKPKTSRAAIDIELDEEGYPLVLLDGNTFEPATSSKPVKRVSKEEKTQSKSSKTDKAASSLEDEAPPAKVWTKMWYKGNNSVGIRRGRGHDDKAQIFSLSNRSWSQLDLEDLGKKCLEKLHKGKSEEEVREWAKAELAK